MSEPNNGQALSLKDNRLLAPKGSQARYTGELLLRTRPKTYRAIVRELAEPNASVNGITRRYRVSNHTVMGIREREAKSIAERKKTLAAMLANVAELGAERMEETIGKASLRDAAIGTGIAVDKMLALTGQMPALQIANIVMPTEAERAERRAMHDKLDAIAKRLTLPE
jgi:transposase-like protein